MDIKSFKLLGLQPAEQKGYKRKEKETRNPLHKLKETKHGKKLLLFHTSTKKERRNLRPVPA